MYEDVILKQIVLTATQGAMRDNEYPNEPVAFDINEEFTELLSKALRLQDYETDPIVHILIFDDHLRYFPEGDKRGWHEKLGEHSDKLIEFIEDCVL